MNICAHHIFIHERKKVLALLEVLSGQHCGNIDDGVINDVNIQVCNCLESYNWWYALSQLLEENAYEVSRLSQFGSKPLFQIKSFNLFVSVEKGGELFILGFSNQGIETPAAIVVWGGVEGYCSTIQWVWAWGWSQRTLRVDSYSKPQKVSMYHCSFHFRFLLLGKAPKIKYQGGMCYVTNLCVVDELK